MYHCLRFNEFEEHDYQKKLQRVEEILESGDWSALDVKKLKNRNMYRAKLDDKARLIFQLTPTIGVYLSGKQEENTFSIQK